MKSCPVALLNISYRVPGDFQENARFLDLVLHVLHSSATSCSLVSSTGQSTMRAELMLACAVVCAAASEHLQGLHARASQLSKRGKDLLLGALGKGVQGLDMTFDRLAMGPGASYNAKWDGQSEVPSIRLQLGVADGPEDATVVCCKLSSSGSHAIAGEGAFGYQTPLE